MFFGFLLRRDRSPARSVERMSWSELAGNPDYSDQNHERALCLLSQNHLLTFGLLGVPGLAPNFDRSPCLLNQNHLLTFGLLGVPELAPNFDRSPYLLS